MRKAAKPLRRADVWPKRATPKPVREDAVSELPKPGDEERPKPRRNRKKKDR